VAIVVHLVPDMLFCSHLRPGGFARRSFAADMTETEEGDEREVSQMGM